MVLALMMGWPAELRGAALIVAAPKGLALCPYLLLPRPPPRIPEYSLLTSETWLFLTSVFISVW